MHFVIINDIAISVVPLKMNGHDTRSWIKFKGIIPFLAISVLAAFSILKVAILTTKIINLVRETNVFVHFPLLWTTGGNNARLLSLPKTATLY